MKLYLWTLKFEFYIIFTCHKTDFFLFFLYQPFKYGKTVISPWAVQAQVSGSEARGGISDLVTMACIWLICRSQEGTQPSRPLSRDTLEAAETVLFLERKGVSGGGWKGIDINRKLTREKSHLQCQESLRALGFSEPRATLQVWLEER